MTHNVLRLTLEDYKLHKDSIVKDFCEVAYFLVYQGIQNGETKEYHHDIAFDELGSVLDAMIETGGMSQ